MRYNTKLSGVTFGNGQQLIAALKDETLVIEADPTNAHDPNALSVRIAEGECVRTHIGWIPKALAAELAPQIAGRSVPVASWIRTGGGEGFSYGLIISFEVA